MFGLVIRCLVLPASDPRNLSRNLGLPWASLTRSRLSLSVLLLRFSLDRCPIWRIYRSILLLLRLLQTKLRVLSSPLCKLSSIVRDELARMLLRVLVMATSSWSRRPTLRLVNGSLNRPRCNMLPPLAPSLKALPLVPIRIGCLSYGRSEHLACPLSRILLTLVRPRRVWLRDRMPTNGPTLVKLQSS